MVSLHEMSSDPIAIERKPRFLAVGGGKGGSGKSFITANIGVNLSKRGRKVIMVDTDLGGANLHTLLGLSPPQATLDDFINKRVGSIREVIAKTEIPNLGLIIGARNMLNAANPKVHQKLRIIRHIQSLHGDFVIVDLGAGNSFNVLDFFLISDDGILVVTPEPTSIENAYRFIKSVFYRKLRRLTIRHEAHPIIQTAMDQRNACGIRTPLDLVEALESIDEEVGRMARDQIQSFRPRLIVNQVRTRGDVEVGLSMRSACLRFFGINLGYLGYVPYDNEVWQSVQRKKPLMLERPYARASRCIEEIASKLLREQQIAFES